MIKLTINLKSLECRHTVVEDKGEVESMTPMEVVGVIIGGLIWVTIIFVPGLICYF